MATSAGTGTGQSSGVKEKQRAPNVLGVCMVGAMMLGACSTSWDNWHHPARNPALTQSDYAGCQAYAEEAALERRHSGRQGYGLERSGAPGVFNPRGDNTMAISDRSDTNAIYSALIDHCMTLKGYQSDQ